PVDDILDGFHEDISDWYPGDSYVDWVGLSWFLRPDFVPANAPENTPSQRQLADEVIAFARENGKPVLIAEASPQGFDLKRGYEAAIAPVWNGTAGEKIQALSPTEIWDAWFAPFFDYIHSNSDSIRAVAYINANWDAQTMWGPPYNQGFWGDSRVQSNPDIEALWNKEIGKPVWLHGHQ
ncbi:MAG: endo-1,3-beta-xylanase, partial [bacterium]